jgi:hypothetical protein
VQCRVEDHPFDEWVAAAVCTLLHKRKFGDLNSLAIAHCIVWELEPLKQNAAFISLIILAMVLQSFELYLVVEKSLGVATCMQDRWSVLAPTFRMFDAAHPTFPPDAFAIAALTTRFGNLL